MSTPVPYWWEDVGNVADLFDWLRSSDVPDEAQTLDCNDGEQVSYFLRKPWKWSHEYDRMRRATTPTTRPAPETPSCRR